MGWNLFPDLEHMETNIWKKEKNKRSWAQRKKTLTSPYFLSPSRSLWNQNLTNLVAQANFIYNSPVFVIVSLPSPQKLKEAKASPNNAPVIEENLSQLSQLGPTDN